MTCLFCFINVKAFQSIEVWVFFLSVENYQWIFKTAVWMSLVQNMVKWLLFSLLISMACISDSERLSHLASVPSWAIWAFHFLYSSSSEWSFLGSVGRRCFCNAFLVEYAVFIFWSLNNFVTNFVYLLMWVSVAHFYWMLLFCFEGFKCHGVYFSGIVIHRHIQLQFGIYRKLTAMTSS